MRRIKIARGISAPRSTEIYLTKEPGSTVNFLAVTAVEVRIVGPTINRSRTFNIPDFTIVSEGQIVAQWLHSADGSDFNSLGVYDVRVFVTLPSGKIESEAFQVEVGN